MVSWLSKLYNIGTVKRSSAGISKLKKCGYGLSWGLHVCFGVGLVSMGFDVKVSGSGGDFCVIYGENPTVSVP